VRALFSSALLLTGPSELPASEHSSVHHDKSTQSVRRTPHGRVLRARIRVVCPSAAVARARSPASSFACLRQPPFRPSRDGPAATRGGDQGPPRAARALRRCAGRRATIRRPVREAADRVNRRRRSARPRRSPRRSAGRPGTAALCCVADERRESRASSPATGDDQRHQVRAIRSRAPNGYDRKHRLSPPGTPPRTSGASQRLLLRPYSESVERHRRRHCAGRMELDSAGPGAAFRRCRSEPGVGRAAPGARSESPSILSLAPARVLACAGSAGVSFSA
jgi:hypothetical protein